MDSLPPLIYGIFGSPEGSVTLKTPMSPNPIQFYKQDTTSYSTTKTGEDVGFLICCRPLDKT